MSENLFVEKTILIPNWDLIVSGTKFKGTICGTEVEGRIYIEDERIFLCQNVKEGDVGDTTLGYDYSWVIYPNDRHNEVEFTLLELDPDFKMPEIIKVGSYLCNIHKGFIKVGCTRVSNELVREIASKLIDKDPNDDSDDEEDVESNLPF